MKNSSSLSLLLLRRCTGGVLAAAMLFVSPLRGDPPGSPSPSPSPPVATSPTPTGPIDPATLPAPKPTPRRAPDGVYYLTEDMSVPIKGGLEGLPAGTRVQLVRDQGDSLVMANGDHQFTVRRWQVTDNLDRATAVQRQTAASEAASVASLQQREAELVKQQREQVEFLRTHPLAAPTPTPSPKK